MRKTHWICRKCTAYNVVERGDCCGCNHLRDSHDEECFFPETECGLGGGVSSRKEEKIATLKEYLLMKVESGDWHAVSDAANDIRVLEGK